MTGLRRKFVNGESAQMKRRQAKREWLEERVVYDGADCLIWPFSTLDGYGNLGIDGQQHYAHRYMCELVNGPAPSPDHQAAHSCGNGGKGCVHPRHITWKTRSENARDRVLHGRGATGKGGLLTPEIADQIKALRGIKTQREIAQMFGTTRQNVGDIQRGRTWTNPYKGTTRSGRRYAASVTINGTYTRIGVFDTREEAAAAYRAKLAELRS